MTSDYQRGVEDSALAAEEWGCSAPVSDAIRALKSSPPARRPLTELENDAYEPGGPMSGLPRPVQVDGLGNTLFDAIAHGDEEHREWLKEAIDCHFAGKPVPPVRSSLKQPADRDATTSPEVARMREALEKIANGDEPRPLGKQWRADTKPSKNDKCVHDRWMYEDCGECVAEVAREALRGGKG